MDLSRSTVLPKGTCQYGLIIAYVALFLCVICKPNGNFHLIFFWELGIIISGRWRRIAGVNLFTSRLLPTGNWRCVRNYLSCREIRQNVQIPRFFPLMAVPLFFTGDRAMHSLCICIALCLHITFDMNITYISVLWFALQGLPFLCGKGTP